MAGSAWRRCRGHVRSRQGKSRCAVVESCGGPRRSGMAGRAVAYCKRGSGRRVWRGIGILPVRQVATRSTAGGRRDIQSVVIVDVAQIASHVGVPVCQQKSGRAVIENAGGPGRNRVARRAGGGRGGKSGRHMVRNVSTDCCGADECSLVASVAIRRAERVVIVDMAGSAGRRRRGRVRPGQSKTSRAVIERRSRPTDCCVACGAVCRGEGSSRRGVHRIIRLLPGGQMAL